MDVITAKAPWLHQTAGLLGFIADQPRLDGARCREHVATFDAAIVGKKLTPDAQELARQVCLACPALDACRRWCDSLSPWERHDLRVAGGEVWPKPEGRRPEQRRIDHGWKPEPVDTTGQDQSGQTNSTDQAQRDRPAKTARQRADESRQRIAARRAARRLGRQTTLGAVS